MLFEINKTCKEEFFKIPRFLKDLLQRFLKDFASRCILAFLGLFCLSSSLITITELRYAALTLNEYGERLLLN